MPYLLTLFACLLLAVNSALAAPPAARVEVHLNVNALQPGQQAAMAVVITIPDGLHSQSHTPTSVDYIPLTLTVEPAAGLGMLSVVYPPGKNVTYPQLGSLNVYDGQVIAYVPLTVDANAQPGALQLSGKVNLQMCNQQSCFAPTHVPFKLETQIVATSVQTAPVNAELFSDFDPRVFATSATQMAEPPAASPAGADIQLFGWSFMLAGGAYTLAFTIAFCVGVIFNLMPCVLPVVPLKALGFYEASQHNRARCFLLGVVFSLGLLSVFAVLAFLVVVQGHLWGELFSSGWFVWSIVTILIVMAAGQLGAYAVVLPQQVYSYVPNHSSLTGNFLFGGFTAILSTPCTAPMFVGLLIWAAQQPTWLGIALVMTVGLGMAIPYLVLAAFPELGRKLPRTGAGSELVKQFMGFLLLAVAAYFAFGRLTEGNSYLWAVFAVVAAGCIFLVVRTVTLTHNTRGITASTVIATILTSAMLYFTLSLTAQGQHRIAWKPFSQEALEQALQTNQPVLLEFTANWCANCKELESRVFTDARISQTIRDLHVLPLRADLTRASAPGWVKLKQINPSGGIPLTVIYSPTLKKPIQLSSIYTTENLVTALKTAVPQ